MMSVKFSEEQLKVIETRSRNILVSAAAGSGKTTVLVERIIQKICDKQKPVDIDRLLIVTFTKAAAASMREKISEALEKKLSDEPENENLQRQSVLLHNAQITTIDSFCLYVLKNNFNDIGLEPGFRVADEGEMRLLKEEIMEKLLEDKLSQTENKNFLTLADRFCKTAKLTPLSEIIYDVYQHALSYPFPLKWLELRKEDYSNEMSYLKEIILYVKRSFRGIGEEIQILLEMSASSDGPYMYEECLTADLEYVNSILKDENYEDIYTKLHFHEYKRLSSKKDESVNEVKRNYIKNSRDVIKKTISKIKEEFFSLPLEVIKEGDLENRKILIELLDTVAEFHRDFQKEKKNKKLIDFSDMEHYALEILLKEGECGYEPTDTAREYREYFDEIMIDEYQDSNLVQEWLLKSVSKEDDGVYNRFMVGDVKQSIYRFRLACPQLFMEKYDKYVIDGKYEMKIDLSKNYRSRKEVLDCTNIIFRKIMGKDLGNIEYDRKNELNYGADYPDNPLMQNNAELILLNSEAEEINSKELEARAVAQRIRELIDNAQVVDEKTGDFRSATYKDIVVLLRKTKQWDEIMRRTFEQYGIPARITTSEGYFSTNEIQTVMNLLQVLDNPKQDIPLYGVMHSVFGGFDDNEMACLSVAKREAQLSFLYDLLRNQDQLQILKEDLKEKCSKFYKFIKKYREKVKYEPIHKLLREIFEESDYIIKIASTPGGEQKKRNVLMLLEKAETFESTSMKGLFSFVRYIEKLKKYKVEFGEASLNEEGVNAVQIMSIHKSKGLEFPICIVAGLGSRFNKSDIQKSLICDTDYGIGFDYVNMDQHAKYSNLRCNLLKKKIMEDNLSEELRILYVAFTRAKEKLILMGMGTEIKETEPIQKMSLTSRLRASSPLDLILPAAVGESVVHIRTLSQEEICKEKILEVVAAEDGKETMRALIKANSRIKEANVLREHLMRSYHHENLKDLYTKVSVSELKIADMKKIYQQENREEPAFVLFNQENKERQIPKFLQEEQQPGGSERGSAYHRILELFPFHLMTEELFHGSKKEQEEGLNKFFKKQCGILQTDGRVTNREISLISLKKIIQFFQTDLARRMIFASKNNCLRREQPFVLGIDAVRINNKFPASEKVLIQGIIDAYFEEDNEIVLLDYKTDRVSDGSELVKRYYTQMEYYTEALQRITGKHVRERILYSFSLNQIVIC